jgi:hypothetical protein
MFVDRQRRSDPWLEWKVRFFLLGAGVAVVGIGMGIAWVVGVAIVILFVGFVIRFLPRPEEEGADPDPNADWTG